MKGENMKKTKEEINQDTEPVVIFVPKDAVKLDLFVTMLDTDNLKTYRCYQKFNISDIEDIIYNEDRCYDFDNSNFTLISKGENEE